jgi:hypothetical protein
LMQNAEGVRIPGKGAFHQLSVGALLVSSASSLSRPKGFVHSASALVPMCPVCPVMVAQPRRKGQGKERLPLFENTALYG